MRREPSREPIDIDAAPLAENDRLRAALAAASSLAINAVHVEAGRRSDTAEERAERKRVDRQLTTTLHAALRIYDDLRACVRAFDELDTASVDHPRLTERFGALEGVLCLIDEELHHFVAIDRSKVLSPLQLELAREDADRNPSEQGGPSSQSTD